MQDLTQLERDVLSLDIRSRGRLAARLLASLDDVSEEEVSEEENLRLWAEEADRRAQDLESGASEAIPFEDVMRDLRSRFDHRAVASAEVSADDDPPTKN